MNGILQRRNILPGVVTTSSTLAVVQNDWKNYSIPTTNASFFQSYTSIISVTVLRSILTTHEAITHTKKNDQPTRGQNKNWILVRTMEKDAVEL